MQYLRNLYPYSYGFDKTAPATPLMVHLNSFIGKKVGECLQTYQVTHHDIHPNDITWCVISSALQQFKEMDHVPLDAPLSSPSEEDDLECQDPFDLGPVDPDEEPDLYSPLTPVRFMAATTPSTEEILQTVC